MISSIIVLLIAIIVVLFILYLVQRYVVPAFPPEAGKWVMALCAIIAILIVVAVAFPAVLH